MLINGKPINPGELRTPVLLAPRSVSTETGGFKTPAPDTGNQVNAWAKWTNAHGQESIRAAMEGGQAPAMALVRYRAGLDETWYVSKDSGSTWYEIVSIDDIQERHVYMELIVKRWRAG